VEFVFRDKKAEETFRTFLAAIPVQPEGSAPPEAISPRGGQALVEFALIVPLVFLLAVNALNLGGFLSPPS
jgi:Flp pilus assembly protein TadG